MVGCVGERFWGMDCCGYWLMSEEIGYGDVALLWEGIG